ncbi:MAG: bifunctional DNA-formamidopyrimidine glycosylase/DNA-(apurinic or apyrimidinic site) lyase [Pseudomonadota bacterium]|nr:bifunctional DNA-formamidopyrimidine glycosylase/DNA-(apurinic or apyrimidinic site) lyase [Pseudomonadota bacterium]MEC8665631.1 bifunctional DNA-formamidopyrimidine glycosylase/DNA-(apurinic or apyrimidinic site) lyase [Pseudomonadota bacterium]
MPELPEVETVMRGMEKVLQGAQIATVEQRRPDLRVPFPPRMKEILEGRSVTALERRAKYILVHFNGAPSFILHLGMSGRVLLVPPAQDYQPQKHDHLILTTTAGDRVVYNDARRFGMVYLADEAGWEAHTAFAGMGPEPLGNEFSGAVLFEALQKKASPIKTTLLDQRVVAGLGNIYVCEALYMAGIHPQRASNSLSVEECESLTQKIRIVLERAIAAGGSTLKDHRKTDGTLGYFQYNFAVYDKEGKSCPDCDCGGKVSVERIKQGGRSTFFCPQKQN